jgi:hypothetical protein
MGCICAIWRIFERTSFGSALVLCARDTTEGAELPTGIMRKSTTYPKAAELSQGRLWVLDRGYADFREFLYDEVRRIPLLGNSVNKALLDSSTR